MQLAPHSFMKSFAAIGTFDWDAGWPAEPARAEGYLAGREPDGELHRRLRGGIFEADPKDEGDNGAAAAAADATVMVCSMRMSLICHNVSRAQRSMSS